MKKIEEEGGRVSDKRRKRERKGGQRDEYSVGGSRIRQDVRTFETCAP